MKTIYLSQLSEPLPPCAATVGFFDGVHRGHQYVIDTLKQKASQRGLASMVITFERHPRQVLQSDWQPQLLSTLSEKRLLLAQQDIDYLVILQFDRTMADLSACEFMDQILRRQLHVQLLLTGYDNRFGHNREEGFDDYANYGRQLGISVEAGQPFRADGLHISSSEVRRLLERGDVSTANRCLGRPYTLAGTVVSGEHVGTGLGFPTANLQVDDPCKLIPAPGVYAVNAWMDEKTEQHPAMTNIGTRPTFDGHRLTLETHILHYRGDLYGQPLTLSFMERLRTEQRFDSPDALARQLKQDAEKAEQRLKQMTRI